MRFNPLALESVSIEIGFPFSKNETKLKLKSFHNFVSVCVPCTSIEILWLLFFLSLSLSFAFHNSNICHVYIYLPDLNKHEQLLKMPCKVVCLKCFKSMTFERKVQTLIKYTRFICHVLGRKINWINCFNNAIWNVRPNMNESEQEVQQKIWLALRFAYVIWNWLFVWEKFKIQKNMMNAIQIWH